MPAVTVAAAAQALGISPRMVRKDIEAGAPTVHRGRRGTAGSLVEVEAFRRWREGRVAPSDPLAEFAALIPALTARVVVENYRRHPSRSRAIELAALWFHLTSELCLAAGAGELIEIPDEIRRLESAIGSI